MKDVFAERFKQERKIANLTLDDIADVCKNRDGQSLSRAAVSMWEKQGGVRPSFENLVAAARKMNVSVDYLVGLIDQKHRIEPTADPLSIENLTDCLTIFREMLPFPEFDISPRKQAEIIKKMMSLIRPDGTLRSADVISIIKPLKQQRREGTNDRREDHGGVPADHRRRHQGIKTKKS